MAEASIRTGVIGFTDSGAPIVLPEHVCQCFRPGRDRLLESRTCWYCSYADFRKTTGAQLEQSICRCPQNRVAVIAGSENESPQTKGEQEQ